MHLAVRCTLAIAIAGTCLSGVQSQAQESADRTTGAAFVMTNSADRNEVIAFRRNEDGSLQRSGTFTTNGRGSGGVTDPLESQGSLVLSRDHSLLFAVNAGTGDVSVFRVLGASLTLIDKVPSGGAEPNAIAQFGDLVYVLNVGGSSNVVGFRLTSAGRLTRIHNAIRFLTTNNSGAASLAFSPDGQFLAVTERATNNIDVFSVSPDGTLSPIVVNSAAAPGSFSLVFARNGAAIVSETGPAGGSNASTISSYALGANGTLLPITTGVPTLGNANCWNVVTPNGRFVYASNAGSSSIAGFSIAPNGLLAPIASVIVGTNPPGSTNLDLAVTSDGKFLYSLNSGTGAIGVFAIQPDGTLENRGRVDGLASNAGMNGIAAF